MRQANNSKSVKKINHSFKALLIQFIAKSLLNFKIIATPFTPAFFQNGRDLHSELLMVSCSLWIALRCTDICDIVNRLYNIILAKSICMSTYRVTQKQAIYSRLHWALHSSQHASHSPSTFCSWTLKQTSTAAKNIGIYSVKPQDLCLNFALPWSHHIYVEQIAMLLRRA